MDGLTLGDLLELMSRYGVVPLLLLISWAGWKGAWIWGHQYRAARQDWSDRLRDMQIDRDAWRLAALQGCGMAERAITLAEPMTARPTKEASA